MGRGFQLGTGLFGFLLGDIGFLLGLCRLHGFGRGRDAQRFSLLLAADSFRLRNFDFRGVLAVDGACIGGGYVDTLVAVGVGLPDLTVAVFLGDALFRVVDRLCSGFLAQRVNVARFVVDIGHVDVDEP